MIITASITVNATVIDFVSLSLTNDVASYVWSGNLVLADLAAYNVCVPGAEVAITVNGVTWNLVVDSRDKQRSWPNDNYSVALRGPAANLGEGTTPINLTLTEDTPAASVVGILAGSNLVDWDVLAWDLVAETVVAEHALPIATIQEIAGACGAVVVSKRNGDLNIRYKHPVGGYAAAVPVVTWDDSAILRISDVLEIKPGYNRVFCGSEGLLKRPEVSITEYRETLSPAYCYLRVRVVPSVTPTVAETSSAISIIATTTETETITEVITLIDGVGNTSQPITSLTSWNYRYNDDLGTLSKTGENEVTAATVGDVVVEITYETTYLQYKLSGYTSSDHAGIVTLSIDDIRQDIRCDCRRGAFDLLSPEIITNRFCVEHDVAEKQGYNYIEENGQNWRLYDAQAAWPSDNILPEVGDIVTLSDEKGHCRALSINVATGEQGLAATVGISVGVQI